jgi:hypothetical protein
MHKTNSALRMVLQVCLVALGAVAAVANAAADSASPPEHLGTVAFPVPDLGSAR